MVTSVLCARAGPRASVRDVGHMRMRAPLYAGANLISDGSELLLEVMSPGLIGGLVSFLYQQTLVFVCVRRTPLCLCRRA